MESDRAPRKWPLLMLPALLVCLPCLLPAIVAGVFLGGGFGALGSLLVGSGGVVSVAVGATLLAVASAIYLARNRWRRGRAGRVIRMQGPTVSGVQVGREDDG